MIIEYENESEIGIALDLQMYIYKKGIKNFTVKASKEFSESLKRKR